VKILNIKVLRGPNYWSNYRQKLIAIKLDLGKFEELPSNLLPDFALKLRQLLPSLYNHACSPGYEGGFFQRLDEGTWLGHIIEHIALELQYLAGMKCGFGRTYGTSEYGIYQVIFSYEVESAGIYAAHAAVNIAHCLAQGNDYYLLEEDLDHLKNLYEQQKLGLGTQAILHEARKRKIPYTRLGNSSMITLGQGIKQKRIWDTLSPYTSAIAFDIAANKVLTKKLLAEHFIPVSSWLTIQNKEELDKAIQSLGFPLIIKPAHGKPAQDLAAAISTKEEAGFAFDLAKERSSEVMLEKFVDGSNYCFLLINYQVIAVTSNKVSVVDKVHPHNLALVERVARLIGLDVCSVDVIASDIHSPLNENNGAVLGVNPCPDLGIHLASMEGSLGDSVAAHFLDLIYPKGVSARIPVTAVTGTNGKTTVVRLIAYLAQQQGHSVGFTTTDGIYRNGKLLFRGDCSGPLSAAAILADPMVDFAVLECARGGILRAGLGFDQCDISIITNVTADHLGLEDIHSLKELAEVKAVVAYSTAKEGHAILNADDDLVYAMKDNLSCNVAFFALAKTPRIEAHCHLGGLAAYIDQNDLIIQRGDNKQKLAEVKNIPLSFNGSATLMIKNILPAVLAGVISGFSPNKIAQALYHFTPSVENTPARMNILDFGNFQIMLDYAHNEDAYVELKQFFSTVSCGKKIGILAASGDRRAEDIQSLGYWAAQIFDEVIIRHNKEKRGRTNEEITDLMLKGIRSIKANLKVKVISEEFEAVRYAMNNAPEGSFIFYSVDDVFDAVHFMLEEKRKFKQETVIK
jgi:UDP-N-acetylmuramyl tripeptide synthase